MEQMRQRSKSQVHGPIGAAPDLFLRISSAGKILDLKVAGDNPSVQQDDFFGKGIHKIPVKEVRERFLEVIRDVLGKKAVVSFEYSLKSPEKESIYEAIVAPLADDEVIAIVRNVAARKAFEGSIQERLKLEEQLSQLAATAPGVIHAYRLRPDGTSCFPYANPKIEEIYGLKPEDLVDDASPALRRAHPDDVLRLKASVEKSARDMSLWREEFRVNHPQKGLIWVEGCSSPVREPDGSILWHGFLLDITERRHAEEELRGKTALLEAQLNSSIEGILVVDNAGKKVIQNQRTIDLWKIPPEIVNENNDEKQVQFVMNRTKHPEQFVEKVTYLYSHPDEVSRDEIELKDGTILDRYSSPVVGKDGKRYGRIWSFHDITGRKKLELELRQSQKMQAFGQLAAGVAHDFNNMLTVIQGNVSLLQMGSLTPAEQASANAEIFRAAERATNLTRQLLTFSRRQPMQARDLDLNEVVANVTKMLQRLIGEDIALETRYASGNAAIHADPGMMEQILMNLAVNARDAMPKGGRLVIETAPFTLADTTQFTKHTARPGEFVRLSITDTGCGVAPEHLPHLFEPFFTTKEVGKGTGLGLATVFGIVEQHHGWIDVDSRVGQGTTVSICFPRLEHKISAEKLQITSQRVPGGNETILLVEDETALRRLVQRVLERHGYHIHAAVSGVQALEVWREHHEGIDVLVTDMVMPNGMNGRELADRLQAEKPGLKIIYCSGYANNMPGKDSPLRENESFLEKPFEPSKLLQKIRDCIDIRG